MLHPEIDDPKQFFTFKMDPEKQGLAISGSNKSSRGQATVGICNLNRTYAKLDRLQNVIAPYVNAVAQIFKQMEENIIGLDQLGTSMYICFRQMEADANNVRVTHTLLRWFIMESLENFERTVLPNISSENQKILLRECYKQFKGLR